MWDVPSVDGLKACPCSCLPLPRPGLPAVGVRLRQAHTAPLPGVSSWSGPAHPSPPSRSDRCVVSQRRLIFRHGQLLEMAETPEPAPG